MSDRVDEKIRAMVVELAQASPLPPPMPTSLSEDPAARVGRIADIESIDDILDRDPVRRGPAIALAAFAVLVMVGIGAWLLLPGGNDESDVASPSAPTTTLPGETLPPGVTTTPGGVAASTTTLPPEPEPVFDISAPLPDHAEITFELEDGTELRGWLFPGDEIGIVVSHPFDTFNDNPLEEAEPLLPYAGALAQVGHTVLLFDQPGHGASAGEPRAPLFTDGMTAAYRRLSDEGVSSIYFAGWGASGAAAVEAVVENSLDVAGIAMLYSPTQYRGLDALTVIDRIEVPLLILHVNDYQGPRWANQLFQKATAEVKYKVLTEPTTADPVVTLWPDLVSLTLDMIAGEFPPADDE